MAQTFRPSANALVVISVAALAAVVIGGGALVYFGQSSTYVTGAFVAHQQPIQFSHERHVAGNGIDCRYCHTSVEQSAFAGIPPTKTCMNCHSQIFSNSPFLEPVRTSFQTGRSLEWRRVHDLPNFVYFNHSIHVAKGVGCSTCHGRVDLMPLMYQTQTLQMRWCLECHRNPERYIRPREAVYRMDYQPPANQIELGRRLMTEYQVRRLTDCSTCHR